MVNESPTEIKWLFRIAILLSVVGISLGILAAIAFIRRGNFDAALWGCSSASWAMGFLIVLLMLRDSE